jgi:hypothetical protein
MFAAQTRGPGVSFVPHAAVLTSGSLSSTAFVKPVSVRRLVTVLDQRAVNAFAPARPHPQGGWRAYMVD